MSDNKFLVDDDQPANNQSSGAGSGSSVPACQDCGEDLELVRTGKAMICRSCGFTTAKDDAEENKQDEGDPDVLTKEILSLFQDIQGLKDQLEALEEDQPWFSRDPSRERVIAAFKRAITVKETQLQELAGEEEEERESQGGW